MGASNSTGDSGYDATVYVRPRDSAFWIFSYSFIIGLGIFAVISNLLFLVTVIGDPALRKTRLSVYLIDMSLIDILSSAGYVVFACGNFATLEPSHLFHRVFLDQYFARFILNIRNIFQLMSSVLIVCIAWERYKAVCRPFQTLASSRHLKLHAAVVLVGTAILIIMVIAAASFAFQDFQYTSSVRLGYEFLCDDIYEERTRFCYLERYIEFKGVPLINVVLFITDFITLAVSMTVFFIIIMKLKSSPALGSSDRHQKEERNLTKMAFVNNIAFVFLVLLQDFSTLSVIVLTISSFPKSGIHVYTIQSVWNLLNSAVNPIIYNVFGIRYRRAMKKTCNACFSIGRKRRQPATPTPYVVNAATETSEL